MKIGAKLFLLVGFLSLLLIAIGVLGLRGIQATDDSLEIIYNDKLIPITLLAQINDQRREIIQQLLLARMHDPKLPESKVHEADHPITQHTDAVEANMAKNIKLLEQYIATTLTAEEKKLTESFVAKRDKFQAEGLDPVLVLLKQRKFEEASLHIIHKTLPLLKEVEQGIEALMQLQVDVAKSEKDKADASYESIRTLAITSIVIGILLALGIGYWIIRSVTSGIGTSVLAISTSATQIAATITQHERTAAQQAAAANETSATLTELSASARQSADQAANAAAAAEKSGAATVQGGDATRQAVAAMSVLKDRMAEMADQILHLSEQTGQIGSIAVLLKDLAGQINMLALNAAVEAARAGEHGKGFAVVAGEIRKLADQSRKSAEQTAVLVADIQKATNTSIMMTEEGARSANEVTQQVHKVAELFNNLSGMAGTVNENAQQVMLNARQQSAAFAQVTEATNSIAAGTRETVAGISQTKIGVQKLNEAAENLKAIV